MNNTLNIDARPERAPTFAETFGKRPNLHAAWQAFEALLWQAEGARPEIYSLCRRRLAQMNGSAVLPGSPDPAVTDDIGHEKEHALFAWWKSDLFDDVERTCLAFAEQFALDPGGISDEMAKPVTDALGPAGTVAFVEALAIFDGFTRFCAMLEVGPDAGIDVGVEEGAGAMGEPSA
jgi:alkylhydroperoxidase family enzyme